MLTNCAAVLELRDRLALDGEDDDGVAAADPDGGGAPLDGLHRVLYLEQMAVGGEDGDRAVVARHVVLSVLKR